MIRLNKLSRQYKIYKLGIKIDNDYQSYFGFLDSKFSNLQKIHFDYTDYFINDAGECVCSISDKFRFIYIRNNIWSILESHYDLNWFDARECLKIHFLEIEYLKNEQISPYVIKKEESDRIEAFYREKN